MNEEDIMSKEFSRPPYDGYCEDLVREYLWLDSRIGRLYRYVESDGFLELPEHERDCLQFQLNLMQSLRSVLRKMPDSGMR